MAASDVTRVLDELLETLESKAGGQRENRRGDAIAGVLEAEPRATKVASLRDSPEAAAFREALVDGLIRVDTANQLLRLVNEVIVPLLA